MSQGNPIALKKTIESFLPVVDEIIFGDVLIFEEDRKIIEGYKLDYPLRTFKFDFNYIFKNGFCSILNELASYAKNKYVVYMNVGEIIEGPSVVEVATRDEFNAYFFDHATESHHWYRFYDKTEVRWRGIIHEELHPIPGRTIKPRFCQTPSFRMADTEKDMGSEFKAKVNNDVKELTYFNAYLRLVDEPSYIDVTNGGWVQYAKDGYQSLSERIQAKGKRLQAFQEGNLEMYLEDIHTNPEFQNEELIPNRIPRES